MSDTAVRPSAVLWDFDGTLVDTEPVWLLVERDLARELGITLRPGYEADIVGQSLLHTGGYLHALAPSPTLTPQQIADRLVDAMVARLSSGPVPFTAGAERLLAGLRARGTRLALVSASYSRLLRTVVDRLPAGTFEAVVSGEEVARGKPDPEPYATACARLGVDPRDTVAIEDSVPGSASANAAGCTVITVAGLTAVPPAPRRTFVGSLADLDPDAIDAIHRDQLAQARRG